MSDKNSHPDPILTGGRGKFTNGILQDLRYALRMMRKFPAFTTVAILTLALGMGANTAIFTLLDAVVLRSIPVKDPQNVVLFRWQAHKNPKYHDYSSNGDCGQRSKGSGCSFSGPFFETVRTQTSSFRSVAAFFGPLQLEVSGTGIAGLADGEMVSGDFFSSLGVNVVLGRPIGPADDSLNSPLTMVLGYNYWQRVFGSEHSVIGRTIRVNNVPVEVIGVASQDFTNLAPGKTQDFFLPLSAIEQIRPKYWSSRTMLESDPYTWWLVIVGRLSPSVSAGQAQAEVNTIFRNEMLHGATPMSEAKDDPGVFLPPISDALSGERGRISSLLYLMMIAVGAILLIACANVAGLLLVRSASRHEEMGLRLALGAKRGRIVRQLLTESLMLSIIGGALAVFFAIWGVHAISALIPGMDHGFVIAPDWRVLAFAVCVIFVTGILFGLAPALRSARADLMPAIKGGVTSFASGTTQTGRSRRLGDALVVTQVALSILVLFGAALLVRTLQNLRSIDPGFDTRNILLFGINPELHGYKGSQSDQLLQDLRDRFAALPGVISASYSSRALLSGGLSGTQVHLEGAPRNQNVDTDLLAVGTDFFSTLRIPMIEGRGFMPADFASARLTAGGSEAAQAPAKTSASSPPSSQASTELDRAASLPPIPIIINKAFAQQYFPKQNPVGRHIENYQGGDRAANVPQPGYTIIGICGDTKYNNLQRAIHPTMYQPLTGGGANFELRTAENSTALISAVLGVVAHTDQNLPVFAIRTQTEQVNDLLVQERMMAQISTFFALLALVMACIGLYGLLSYEVLSRTREIGIRMALGAKPYDILKIVIGKGLLLALVGAAIGIGAAIGVTRFISAMLYGVQANDPVTTISVVILLAVVALVACLIPARRAMRVDPLIALRYE